MSSEKREMPRYKCHKEVWALKIIHVDLILGSKAGAIITPHESGYSSFYVCDDYIKKHNPEAGGYYVVYKNGHESWSPAEEFENGYTIIPNQVDYAEVSRVFSFEPLETTNQAVVDHLVSLQAIAIEFNSIMTKLTSAVNGKDQKNET